MAILCSTPTVGNREAVSVVIDCLCSYTCMHFIRAPVAYLELRFRIIIKVKTLILTHDQTHLYVSSPPSQICIQNCI